MHDPSDPAADADSSGPPPQTLLLAEELAIVAMHPETRRHSLGTRSLLNACLAALLIAELDLRDDHGDSPVLVAAAAIRADRGPKPRAVLAHMDRGLRKATGLGTWDTVTANLDSATMARRDSIVWRLQEAASSDTALDIRTALLLSFAGPAALLEVVAPRRAGRRHARWRIDHILDDTPFADLRRTVKRLLSDQSAAAVAPTTAAVMG